MATNKSQIEKWITAQKKHRLSDTHVQMARELGLNPDKLGKIDNHRQETWKAPLPQFIEDIYFKHFKTSRCSEAFEANPERTGGEEGSKEKGEGGTLPIERE